MGHGGARAVLLLMPTLLLGACAGVPGTAVVATTATSRPAAFDGGRFFDEDKVAVGVGRVLTQDPPSGYGFTGVQDVRCPANQPVRAGTSFECELRLDGNRTTVTIVVKDDDGLYEVNPPN